MNEYRVTIDSATEQWVYEVDAEDESSAREQGLYAAQGDGYHGAGMWVGVEEL